MDVNRQNPDFIEPYVACYYALNLFLSAQQPKSLSYTMANAKNTAPTIRNACDVAICAAA